MGKKIILFLHLMAEELDPKKREVPCRWCHGYHLIHGPRQSNNKTSVSRNRLWPQLCISCYDLMLPSCGEPHPASSIHKCN